MHAFLLTHSHVWHDSFSCVTWLIDACDVFQVGRDSFVRVTWLTYVCDMTFRRVRYDSLIHVACHMDACEKEPYKRDDMLQKRPIMHVSIWSWTWIILTWDMSLYHVQMHDMTDSYVWHDVFIRVTELIDVSHVFQVGRDSLVYLISPIEWFRDSIFHTNRQFVETP